MDDHKFNPDFCKEDIHGFFQLSYANYLTIPRSVLQSMPPQWQHDFTKLLEQMQELYGGYDMDYTVYTRDKQGRFLGDPLSNYERGRRFVPPKKVEFN